MTQRNDGGTAFPMQDSQAIHAHAMAASIDIKDSAERERAYIKARSEAIGGMSLRQYAAIKLRVPDSGTDWLDSMIRRSLKDDLASKVMQGTCALPEASEVSDDRIAKIAYRLADAMLAARERS